MSPLTQIRRGKDPRPPRILIYGTESIGQSTFASMAPAPIFIQTEDGLGEIDCDKFPLANTLQDVLNPLSALLVEEHDYQTVVIDSLDWLERLVWDELCRQYHVNTIEKVDGGFSKGYTHALTPWRRILALLDRLRLERGMLVLAIAPSKVEKFDDPESTSYDRYSPRLHKHVGGLVCEWADAVLFATRKIRVQSEDAGFNRKRGIAFGLGKEGGERVLRTMGSPSCVAKSRYPLPEELPLDWPSFFSALTNPNPTNEPSTPDLLTTES